jgi:hypothetical protein
MLQRIVWWIVIDFSEMLIAFITTLMLVAVSSSEKLVSNYRVTLISFPEISHFHIHRHENIKSHLVMNPSEGIGEVT